MTITSCPRLIFVLAFAAACGVSNDGFAQTDSDLTSGQIRDAADRVMKQHDYRSVRRRMLENIEPDRERGGFLQDSLSRMAGGIGDFFEWIFSGLFTSRNRNTGGGTAPSSPVPAPSSGGGLDLSFGTVLLYLALAILVVITVWLIAAVVRKSDGRRSLDRRGLFGEDEDLADLSIPPGELAASNLRIASQPDGSPGKLSWRYSRTAHRKHELDRTRGTDSLPKGADQSRLCTSGLAAGRPSARLCIDGD